jgi:hypothetical protein
MKNNFDHIESQVLRDICRETMSPTRAALAYAIGWSDACLSEDYKGACLSCETLDARESFLKAARLAYSNDNAAQCVKALQAFWSV